MGIAKYRHLLTELDRAPHGGGMGAEAFDQELFSRIGCNIAWHRTRRCYVVYKHVGNNIKTYMDLVPERHFPLVSTLIPLVMSTIKAANAYMSEDPSRAILEYFSRAKVERKRDIKGYVDERFPDFRRYAEWSWNKLNSPHSRSITKPNMKTAYNLQ